MMADTQMRHRLHNGESIYTALTCQQLKAKYRTANLDSNFYRVAFNIFSDIYFKMKVIGTHFTLW
ncbi:hypothetical protein GCM10007086_06090 [Photobacterium aphoticum]|nr:hypothetical protein C9I90_01755 [Photobacterium aphoticum]GHA35257.1 hypothetical protein GCM10007086_06090 [Photobacterium aphoticum]